MTEEEIDRILQLVNELSGPILTLRMWYAQEGKKGRAVALEKAASKIHAAVQKYAEERL